MVVLLDFRMDHDMMEDCNIHGINDLCANTSYMLLKENCLAIDHCYK